MPGYSVDRYLLECYTCTLCTYAHAHAHTHTQLWLPCSASKNTTPCAHITVRVHNDTHTCVHTHHRILHIITTTLWKSQNVLICMCVHTNEYQRKILMIKTILGTSSCKCRIAQSSSVSVGSNWQGSFPACMYYHRRIFCPPFHCEHHCRCQKPEIIQRIMAGKTIFFICCPCNFSH